MCTPEGEGASGRGSQHYCSQGRVGSQARSPLPLAVWVGSRKGTVIQAAGPRRAAPGEPSGSSWPFPLKLYSAPPPQPHLAPGFTLGPLSWIPVIGRRGVCPPRARRTLRGRTGGATALHCSAVSTVADAGPELREGAGVTGLHRPPLRVLQRTCRGPSGSWTPSTFLPPRTPPPNASVSRTRPQGPARAAFRATRGSAAGAPTSGLVALAHRPASRGRRRQPGRDRQPLRPPRSAGSKAPGASRGLTPPAPPPEPPPAPGRAGGAGAGAGETPAGTAGTGRR